MPIEHDSVVSVFQNKIASYVYVCVNVCVRKTEMNIYQYVCIHIQLVRKTPTNEKIQQKKVSFCTPTVKQTWICHILRKKMFF